MVFLTMAQDRKARLIDFLQTLGIKAGGYGQLRLVTHRDVAAGDIAIVVDAVNDFVKQGK